MVQNFNPYEASQDSQVGSSGSNGQKLEKIQEVIGLRVRVG